MFSNAHMTHSLLSLTYKHAVYTHTHTHAHTHTHTHTHSHTLTHTLSAHALTSMRACL